MNSYNKLKKKIEDLENGIVDLNNDIDTLIFRPKSLKAELILHRRMHEKLLDERLMFGSVQENNFNINTNDCKF